MQYTKSLSNETRLIFINQLKILNLLENTTDYNNDIEALELGIVSHYPFEYCLSPEMSKTDFAQLTNILEMFCIIYESFDQLNNKEKKQIPDRYQHILQFNGFDDHLRDSSPEGASEYTEFLVTKKGRFTTLKNFKTGKLISKFYLGAPVWDRYCKMLEVYNNIKSTKKLDSRVHLSLDELTQIASIFQV